MTKKIYVGIDNEKFEAEGEILEQILKDKNDAELAVTLLKNEQIAQAKAKAELLDRLGITAEEAKLLLA